MVDLRPLRNSWRQATRACWRAKCITACWLAWLPQCVAGCLLTALSLKRWRKWTVFIRDYDKKMQELWGGPSPQFFVRAFLARHHSLCDAATSVYLMPGASGQLPDSITLAHMHACWHVRTTIPIAGSCAGELADRTRPRGGKDCFDHWLVRWHWILRSSDPRSLWLYNHYSSGPSA